MLAGLVLGLSASVCWAIVNVAIQRSTRQVGSVRALLWAQVVGVALVAAVAPFVDGPRAPVRAVDVPWLAGAGVASLMAYLAMFYAFEHGRLTVAVPVMSSWAVIAGSLSLALFADRVRPLQLAGAAAVITGALVVARAGQRGGPAARAEGRETRRWLLAAVMAAVGFGVLIPALGRLAPFAGGTGSIALVYLADMALGLPLALRFRVSLAPPPRQVWPTVAAVGLFETGGFTCIALGGHRAPLALVAPLASLSSAFTVLYAWLVLRERPSAGVLAGAALASAGVVALAL
jgi:drug/metabolite transporter (DMT)-like permease